MEPEVTTKLGKIKGKIEKDVRGKKFYSFLGIPYAQAPVGKLRFKAPKPIEPWTEILDATKVGNECIQRHLITKTITGSEDCLNLNVFTPELPESHLTNRLRAVMVYVHGGNYTHGSNNPELYGPQFLVAEDVILVTINYRVGLFGFLCLEDDSLGVNGNMAYKDMVLALKWVKDHISNFNGNPENITLFGESAGAAAAHLLMLSPVTKGLFHKVIAQSGSALSGWTYYKKETTKQFADKLKLNPENEKEYLEKLLNLPAEDLYKAQNQIIAEELHGNKYRCVGLVIEKQSPSAFLSKHPLEILKSGDYHKVPLMMGYTKDEGLMFKSYVDDSRKCIYWDDPETNVPDLLEIKKGSSLSLNLAKKIVNFYLGEGPYSVEKDCEKMYEMTTDNCFLWGMYASIKYHSKFSDKSVYFYRMSIESHLNFYKTLCRIKLPGVCHADDIGYLFKTFITPPITPGSIEDVSQRRFCKLWSNFAKVGNPTPTTDDMINANWDTVTPERTCYMDIGKSLELLENPEPERLAFWDEIYKIGFNLV